MISSRLTRLLQGCALPRVPAVMLSVATTMAVPESKDNCVPNKGTTWYHVCLILEFRLACRRGKVYHTIPTPIFDLRPTRFRAPNTLRDRSALLGATPPPSGRSSPFNQPLNEPTGHHYVDDLEGQNDEALEGLSAKVKLLKDVCGGILLGFRPSHVCPSDYDWYWERGTRIDHPTQPNGTFTTWAYFSYG